MKERERAQKVLLAMVAMLFSFAVRGADAQSSSTPSASSATTLRSSKTPQQRRNSAATNRFSARVDVTLANPAASKGEWGLLIADATTGETLYALNDDKYFVPASNMKLFSTALALSKLGVDYKFHTTLETRGTISD
ncbi:MAG TPA: D-alanyl-D-alanine carboxypeptidase, partial [Candidatus Acidoferrum sp.]